MSRSTGWFRFYDRMIDSPQVLELNDTEFRLLVSMWCLASGAEARGVLPYSPRALQRRVLPDHTIEDVEVMITHLVDLNLLRPQQIDGGQIGYAVVNWDEHQYEHASWTPEARRGQKQKERQAASQAASSNVATMSQARRNDVASGRNTDTDVDAEEDAEPEGEIPPPPSVVGEVRRQRQQRARTHTHEEPPPADAHPADSAPQAHQADVAAPEAAMCASPGTSRQERLPDDEFLRQFADAADLPASARGQALDAIIAEYRPRAPDGVLIVEAYSFREFYPKRPRNNRLLANWMATWWTRRQATIAATAAQPSAHTREEAQRGQRQHQPQPAAASSRYRGAARRRFDPPDPTRNGAYAHRIRDSSDFPDDDG